MSVAYKIRRVDGLFSNGGRSPKFSTPGKVWKNLGTLKLHLMMEPYSRMKTKPVVVEYEMMEKGTCTLDDLQQEILQRRRERAAEARVREETRRRAADLRKLAELKAAYE